MRVAAINFFSLLLIAQLVAGCGVDPVAVATSAVDVQALADLGPNLPDGGYDLWPRVAAAYPIHVCFTEASIALPSGSWAADKALAANALTNTWEAASAIDFQFEGDCPASIPADWMPIQLTYDSTLPSRYGGFGQFYRGARLNVAQCANCQVLVNFGSQRFEFETTVVHEVGHALGFIHERQRSDFGGCLAVDGSWVAPELGPNAFILSSPDLMSVMSNWECYETRAHDSYSYYQLSLGDMSSVSMVYPRQLSRGLRSIGARNGFNLASGILIRGDGSLVTDWTAMKAASTVFLVQPAWWYNSASGYVFLGSGIEVSPGPVVSNQMIYIFVDRWGRTNVGTDFVEVSSRRHASLVHAVRVLDW